MIYKKDGFDYCFDSSKCQECQGKCCTGESGFIYVDSKNILALQEKFALSAKEVKERFLIKVGFKYSIKEKAYENGFACIFFDEKNKNCSIYDIRPLQCKTFPFWDYFKENFKDLEKECIGIKAL